MKKSILKIITLLTLFTFPTTLLVSCNNNPQVISKTYEYFDGKGNVDPKYLPSDKLEVPTYALLFDTFTSFSYIVKGEDLFGEVNLSNKDITFNKLNEDETSSLDLLQSNLVLYFLYNENTRISLDVSTSKDKLYYINYDTNEVYLSNLESKEVSSLYSYIETYGATLYSPFVKLF